MGPPWKITTILFSFLLCVAFFAERVQGSAVPALYVLGDSLADVGNNNNRPLTLAKANFPHNGIDYPGHEATGRFSNGFIFVDYLASSLGLASPPAYHSIRNITGRHSIRKGVNFASAGAGISDLTYKGQSYSFDEQIERDYFKVYSELVQQLGGQPQALAHLAKSIFAIAIGSNDIIINSVLLPVGRPPIISSQQFVDSLAQTLKCQLQRMYELGMRRLFFLGAGPIGCVPFLRQLSLLTKQCHAKANSLSVEFNKAVISLLRDMSMQHPDFKYSFFDTYTALLEYIQEPEANGFAEVKAACCGLGVKGAMFFCTQASEYCANRTNHMFWDVFHPTEITTGKLMRVAVDGFWPFVLPINVRQLSAL